MDLPVFIGVGIIVVIAAVTDIWRRKIYNWLTFPAMALALVYHIATAGFSGLQNSLLGLLAGFGLMLVPHLLGKMGAGDVKLMAAVGAALGPVHVFWAVVWSSLAGGVYALIIVAIKSGLRSFNLKDLSIKLAAFGPRGLAADLSSGAQQNMCYGVALAVGTIGYMFMRRAGLWIAPWT